MIWFFLLHIPFQCSLCSQRELLSFPKSLAARVGHWQILNQSSFISKPQIRSWGSPVIGCSNDLSPWATLRTHRVPWLRTQRASEGPPWQQYQFVCLYTSKVSLGLSEELDKTWSPSTTDLTMALVTPRIPAVFSFFQFRVIGWGHIWAYDKHFYGQLLKLLDFHLSCNLLTTRILSSPQKCHSEWDFSLL